MSLALRLSALSPLILVALAVDVLTPFLIWKGVLPSASRWLSHAALAGMIGLGAYRITRGDRVPAAAVWIFVVGIIGCVVALLQGQPLLATAWGGWTWFAYPLVGTYCYLLPQWPSRFGELLLTACMGILAAAVLVQLAQFALGERQIDNLAGLFGQNGTARLALFALFTLSLALGRWLVEDRLGPVLWVGALGLGASVIGEMKILPFAAFLLCGLAAVAYALVHRRWQRLFYLGSFAVVAGALFVTAYNAVVPGEPFEQFLTAKGLSRYLNLEPTRFQVDGTYGYSQGRNATLVNAWTIIRQDPGTLLFGTGMGAGRESASLQTAGAGLQQGMLRMIAGSDLAAVVLELGVFGVVVWLGALAWIVGWLYRGARRTRDPDLAGLCLGLLLFSLMWPVWMWYTTVLGFRVTMLLYAVAMGYVFRAARAGL